MKKIIGILFLLVAGIFLLNIYYFDPIRIKNKQKEVWTERILENNYKEYIPIVFQQDHLMDVPELLTQEHVKNVIHVLKYYDEKWKIENGKLFVSNEIDREILWNYTTKANDSIWLSENLLEK
ncbi:hypothetical protein [Flavobacterium mesophilum]|uniref:hypothetical protein n=1 Tax=Flavobacterium mesophilum TaxID=3143495 RepID=UPI0031D64E20